MESPVVIDKPPEYHGNARDNERGFPFDEEEGSGAWSELAARHPDIAARLRQRPATWARKRRPSSQDATDGFVNKRSVIPDFGESFSGFDRFPFDDIPPEFREHFPSHWNRRFSTRDEPDRTGPPPAPHPPQPPHSPHAPHPPHAPHSPQQHTAATQTDSPERPDPPHQHLPQYGLRNTVDLGQRSPADPSLVDADERNQRSMSAPPDGCTQSQSTGRMSAPNHQEHPPHADQAQQSSNVRHIPIFVEGRDEPVINKSVDHGTHFGDAKPAYAPPHAERDQYYDDGPAFHPPTNFSRAFGTPFNKGFRQGPQPFVQQKVYPQTAFARGASPQRSQSPKPQSPHAHDEHFVKVPVQHEHKPEPQPRPQQRPPPQQQQPHQQPPHQQQPPQQQQPPKQQTPPPQPKPQEKQAPSPNDPITLILSIQTDVLNLMSEVENFIGTKKDKKYLFLDEMLTRNLIKLDNIETEGKENIRLARKEAIKCIQKCIAVLEAKADKGSAAPPADADMAEAAPAEPPAENGEVEMSDTRDQAAPPAPPADQPPAASEPVRPEEAAAAPPAPPAPAAQAPDTRPADAPPAAPADESAEQDVEKKASPKKAGKSVKKRDKSKDNKDKDTKDSSKEPTEAAEGATPAGAQGDAQGDAAARMEVDGAASQ